MSILSNEANNWIETIRQRYSFDEIMRCLDRASKLNVLVVGDGITDIYNTVEQVGLGVKRGMPAYIAKSQQRWVGGAELIALNIQQLCGHVQCWLGSNIEKTRYIRENGEVVYYEERPNIIALSRLPDNLKGGFDIVVVADFGHGSITSQIQKTVIEHSNYLAVMCQTNSLNYGFNLLRKWPHADFGIANETEIRLNWSDKNGLIAPLVVSQKQQWGCSTFIATLGKVGSVAVQEEEYIEIPALACDLVDLMGAGDAYYAYAAPLACVGAPTEIISLVGSVAASVKIARRGNDVVRKDEVLNTIRQLLRAYDSVTTGA